MRDVRKKLKYGNVTHFFILFLKTKTKQKEKKDTEIKIPEKSKNVFVQEQIIRRNHAYEEMQTCRKYL